MSGETTLGRIGSKFTEYFSGITRESVGQFCTAKKDYVVSFVRNIPGFMQESHSNAAIVLVGANILCHAILDFAALSPVERRMEASTTDQERLLTKKKFLNLLGAGTAFYFLNIGLSRLHKYELSRTQLLLITALVVSYRLFRLTMPQVVLPTPTPEELEAQARGAVALAALESARDAELAEQAALAAEALVPDALQQPLAGALQAQADLEALEAAFTAANNNRQVQAVLAAARRKDWLREQVEAVQAEIAGINNNNAPRHLELTARLDGVAEDQANNVVAVIGLRQELQQAEDALRLAREAAGQQQNGDVPEDSLLGIVIAAQTAFHNAREVVENNKEALAEYEQLAEAARIAREAANVEARTAADAQGAVDALLNPVPAP